MPESDEDDVLRCPNDGEPIEVGCEKTETCPECGTEYLLVYDEDAMRDRLKEMDHNDPDDLIVYWDR